MEKPFFDVFPTLEMNAELKNLFSVTKVTRVAMTRARDFLKVYLSSEKLIRKKDIYQVENTIREQLFSGVPMTVKIIEKFSLSRQYTPEKLMDAYKDSILLELKEYSIFEFNLFRKADCVFENEDTLHLTLEETVISEGKGEELIRILEKIFTERCGMSLKIHVDYKEAVESKARRNGELREQQPEGGGIQRRIQRERRLQQGGLQGQRTFWRRRLQPSGAPFRQSGCGLWKRHRGGSHSDRPDPGRNG